MLEDQKALAQQARAPPNTGFTFTTAGYDRLSFPGRKANPSGKYSARQF